MSSRAISILKIATVCAAPFVLLLVQTQEAEAWYCRATSPTGSWGWGTSPSRGRAAGIALSQCAIRTPRGFVCRLRYCT
jgi:hypothetical protein